MCSPLPALLLQAGAVSVPLASPADAGCRRLATTTAAAVVVEALTAASGVAPGHQYHTHLLLLLLLLSVSPISVHLRVNPSRRLTALVTGEVGGGGGILEGCGVGLWGCSSLRARPQAYQRMMTTLADRRHQQQMLLPAAHADCRVALLPAGRRWNSVLNQSDSSCRLSSQLS